jgi:hypothetical protein
MNLPSGWRPPGVLNRLFHRLETLFFPGKTLHLLRESPVVPAELQIPGTNSRTMLGDSPEETAMSNRNITSRITGTAATFAVAMIALLAACSQTHDEPAADAATLNVPASASESNAVADMPEIVIVASRDEPRNRG